MNKRQKKKRDKKRENARKMLRILGDIAERMLSPEPQWWLRGWDEGFSFCEKCVKLEAERLWNEEHEDYKPVHDYCCNQESDYMTICDTCGHPLYCSIVDHKTALADAGNVKSWRDVLELVFAGFAWYCSTQDLNKIKIPAWMKKIAKKELKNEKLESRRISV